MEIQFIRSRIGRKVLIFAGSLVIGVSVASAQAPTPPVPSPTLGPSGSPSADASPGELAERVRKLEEMNQRLLQQYTERISTVYERIKTE